MASNAAKHGVTFEEAKSVFYDEDALEISDPDHSKEEERFIIMGRSGELSILVVIHLNGEFKRERKRLGTGLEPALRTTTHTNLKRAIPIRYLLAGAVNRQGYLPHNLLIMKWCARQDSNLNRVAPTRT